MSAAVSVANSHLRTGEGASFHVFRIDTVSNSLSVMGPPEYDSYNTYLVLHVPMKQSASKTMKGIGGSGTVLFGEATIQISLMKLCIILDVNFFILKEYSPSLLSHHYIFVNVMYIILQVRYLHIGVRRQPLTIENYIFVYRWSAETVPYVLSTEQYLRQIHGGFSHPSVGATDRLLKHASQTKLTSGVNTVFQKIQDGFKTCQTLYSAPRRFKSTVCSEKLKFNHDVNVYIIFPVCSPRAPHGLRVDPFLRRRNPLEPNSLGHLDNNLPPSRQDIVIRGYHVLVSQYYGFTPTCSPLFPRGLLRILVHFEGDEGTPLLFWCDA